MSQHDFNITTEDANTGVTVRAQINAALQALASNSAGTGDPDATYPRQWKADEQNDLLMIRNGANDNWIVVGKLSEIYLGLAALAAQNDFTASQKLKGDALIWRFRDTGSGGGELGIRSDGNALEIVRNTGTEESPTWVVTASFGTAFDEKKGDDIASAAAIDLGAAGGNYVNVTGTTTITSLGTTPAGVRRIVNFTGELMITYNATSLILPTEANINTAAGDVAVFVSLGSGNWKCVGYTRTDGQPLAGGGSGNVGDVMIRPTGTVPEGYLECDGSSLSRTTYAALFAVIGTTYGNVDGNSFNLPDYRGRFLRGWAHGQATDPDRAARTSRGDGTTGDNVGTKQADEFKSHTHTHNSVAGEAGNVAGRTPATGTGALVTGATGGNETRPININVMYCIKY